MVAAGLAVAAGVCVCVLWSVSSASEPLWSSSVCVRLSLCVCLLVCLGATMAAAVVATVAVVVDVTVSSASECLPSSPRRLPPRVAVHGGSRSGCGYQCVCLCSVVCVYGLCPLHLKLSL